MVEGSLICTAWWSGGDRQNIKQLLKSLALYKSYTSLTKVGVQVLSKENVQKSLCNFEPNRNRMVSCLYLLCAVDLRRRLTDLCGCFCGFGFLSRRLLG